MAGTETQDVAEPGSDAVIAVPSGQKVTLMETIWNSPGPEGMAVRFRFLAPAIARQGGSVDAGQADADIQALCSGFALARLAEAGGAAPDEIIISLSDQVVPFGETHPEATQYIASFTLLDGACVPSLF